MTQPATVDLTLVLPLYNEGAVLRSNLEFIDRTLLRGGFSYELILIDDKSQDESAQTAQTFAQEHGDHVTFIQHETNQGRGGTVMDGMRRSRGTVVGFIDVDCEASPKYILEFIPDLLADRFDAITGMRIYPFSLSTMVRGFFSVTYRWLVWFVLRVGFRDRQSGYKFFRRVRVLPLFGILHHTGWFWDTEIMVVAAMAGLRVNERPILFLRDTKKKSTVRLIRDGLVMVKQLFFFRLRLRQIKKSLTIARRATG